MRSRVSAIVVLASIATAVASWFLLPIDLIPAPVSFGSQVCSAVGLNSIDAGVLKGVVGMRAGAAESTLKAAGFKPFEHGSGGYKYDPQNASMTVFGGRVVRIVACG